MYARSAGWWGWCNHYLTAHSLTHDAFLSRRPSASEFTDKYCTPPGITAWGLQWNKSMQRDSRASELSILIKNYTNFGPGHTEENGSSIYPSRKWNTLNYTIPHAVTIHKCMLYQSGHQVVNNPPTDKYRQKNNLLKDAYVQRISRGPEYNDGKH